MSHNPTVCYKEALEVVKSLGYKKRGQVGSHVQFKHPGTGRKATLPNYGKKVYGPDLFSNVCRQLDMSKKDFFVILASL